VAIDPEFPKAPPKNAAIKFVNADGTSEKTLVIAGTTGICVEVFEITSTDTTSRDLTIKIGDGTTDYFFDTLTIPAATGTNKVVKVNVLDLSRRGSLVSGNIRKLLGENWRFKAKMESAVTAGFEIAVLCDYGEY
jgi:hypothetical protein